MSFALQSETLLGRPSIPRRIACRAAAAPNDIAVVDGTIRLTYAELEARSDGLAAQCREAGAAPDRCIGLFLERSAQFVVAALAVLKSGAAYLPLDPSTPPDRLAFILADAKAIALLTDSHKARAAAPGPWRVIDLDAADAISPVPSATFEPDPQSLAYVIYTSGSTGEPKGVEITHANLCNLVDWHQSAFEVTEADRAAHIAGLGFDAAVWELWPYLTTGARLSVADDATRRSPEALRDWLIAERITISFAPTVLAEQLLAASWPPETSLRTMLTGGDTLHRRPAPDLPFVVVNNYGPTECTVVATSGIVSPQGTGQPSLGRPIANATALILDDALRPVAEGEPGELCLAGALVGRGYRNQPELTASRFVTYLSASGEVLRIYRTGDLVRLLENGEIAFLGRIDDQVKIRGYRIEPNEIVTCLNRFPDVEVSAVSVSDVGEAGPSLVAYVVPRPDAQLASSALREFLATQLPDYMVPGFFVPLSTLPMTLNGKLDKSALPAPTADLLLPARAPENDAAGLPNALQEQLAALVASLLGQPSIDPHENFFMAGGHSVLAVQLVARIREQFHVTLSLRQLFTAPTVAALSAEVARLGEGAREARPTP